MGYSAKKIPNYWDFYSKKFDISRLFMYHMRNPQLTEFYLFALSTAREDYNILIYS